MHDVKKKKKKKYSRRLAYYVEKKQPYFVAGCDGTSWYKKNNNNHFVVFPPKRIGYAGLGNSNLQEYLRSMSYLQDELSLRHSRMSVAYISKCKRT